MKILLTIPGNLRTVPMSRYVRDTLRLMGHETAVFDYSGGRGLYPRLLKKLSTEMLVRATDKELLRLVDKVRPDALLTLYGFNHSAEAVEAVRARGVPAVCWWLNDPFQFERSVLKAGCYDHYFTNSNGIIEEYNKRGLRGVHYLPVGVQPEVHRRQGGAAADIGVCFAGDWSPVREKVLDALHGEFPLTIFGPWRNKLGRGSRLRASLAGGKFFTPEEMARIFNRSKVVLNVHTWFGRFPYGINPRVFEACGCGAFQLCDRKQEIAALYREDEEIVLYDDVEELKQKLRRYLADDAGRKRIADNAYARTHACHTYRHRLEEMFRVAGLS